MDSLRKWFSRPSVLLAPHPPGANGLTANANSRVSLTRGSGRRARLCSR